MHPTDGEITQEFYQTNQASGQAFPHTGDDYAANRGDPVRTIADGTVIHAGSGPVPDWLANRFMLFPGSASGGNYVFIQHEGWVEYFGHLEFYNVGGGAKVRRGQTVGGAGDSGNSLGVHLHYEVIQEPCSPLFPWGRYNPQLQISHENQIMPLGRITDPEEEDLNVDQDKALARTWQNSNRILQIAEQLDININNRTKGSLAGLTAAVNALAANKGIENIQEVVNKAVEDSAPSYYLKTPDNPDVYALDVATGMLRAVPLVEWEALDAAKVNLRVIPTAKLDNLIASQRI